MSKFTKNVAKVAAKAIADDFVREMADDLAAADEWTLDKVTKIATYLLTRVHNAWTEALSDLYYDLKDFLDDSEESLARWMSWGSTRFSLVERILRQDRDLCLSEAVRQAQYKELRFLAELFVHWAMDKNVD